MYIIYLITIIKDYMGCQEKNNDVHPHHGRLSGLFFDSGYGMAYGQDTYGRFGSINAQVARTGPQTYTYSYLQNSDLLESLSTSQGLTVSRTYEPNRDVLTQVQNQFGTNIISQYDYTNDELAQHSSMTTSGTAPSTESILSIAKGLRTDV